MVRTDKYSVLIEVEDYTYESMYILDYFRSLTEDKIIEYAAEAMAKKPYEWQKWAWEYVELEPGDWHGMYQCCDDIIFEDLILDDYELVKSLELEIDEFFRNQYEESHQ